MNCILIRPLWMMLKKLTKCILMFLGAFMILMFVLSFTSLPFWAHYYLGIYGDEIKEKPDAIVVLGGAGMPSKNGLIRTYYAAKIADEYTDIPIIIALPGDTLDPESSVRLMGLELIIRGVNPDRMVYENEGTNTRWEALSVKNRFFPNSNPKILIVSSPSHMYRAVKTFKKAGFSEVGSIASFGKMNETDLKFDAQALGAESGLPDVGGSVSLRYSFWTRMHLQLTVLREYTAIAYYWLMGWI